MKDAESNKLIVIVEDDPDVARIIEQVLSDFSFRTVWCRSASDLLRRLRALSPDLCIIDLGLPDMDGIEAMQRVRAQSGCGILILTGRAHVSDRVMGLELGADDYVTKPFSPSELMARAKAALRRARPQSSEENLSYADLAMDLATHRVRRGSHDLHLGPTEFRLLKFLMENQGRVFSREQLLDHVWGRDIYVEPRTVDVHIRRLRKAINIDGLPDLIRTVRSAGYALDIED